VPKLWTDTIEEHRQRVRDAIVETTAELIDERGLLSVTMSAIAERTGIGRATLYKYFRDVETILLTWHEEKISGHLEQLARLARQPGTSGERVTAVLDAYALMRHSSRGQHDTDLAAFLHRGHHLASGHGRKFVGGSGPDGWVAEVEAAGGVEGVFGETAGVAGG